MASHQMAPSINCSLDDIDLNALKVSSSSRWMNWKYFNRSNLSNSNRLVARKFAGDSMKILPHLMTSAL
jgi:hypothetical protein